MRSAGELLRRARLEGLAARRGKLGLLKNHSLTCAAEWRTQAGLSPIAFGVPGSCGSKQYAAHCRRRTSVPPLSLEYGTPHPSGRSLHSSRIAAATGNARPDAHPSDT
jgi:hypothetical protein